MSGETGVDPVTGETVEGEQLEVGSALVRDETGEALGTTTVDVQTMTTDELSEVMIGLDTPQLMSLSQLTMAGISVKGALEYFVNGDAQALAKEIADKQQTNIIAELDKDTSTAIQTALTTTRTRTLADDTPTPTATDIQNYLDQVAGEDTSADDGAGAGVGMTTLDEVAGEQYNRIDRLMNQTEEADPALYMEMEATEALYDPTKSLTTEQAEALLPPVVETPTPNVTYAQPASDPYAEVGRPSRRSNDDSGPSHSEIMATHDAIRASRAAAANKALSNNSTASVISSSSNQAATAAEAKKIEEKLENISKGGSGGFNEGGLVGKPKKKPARKKRGVAARKK